MFAGLAQHLGLDSRLNVSVLYVSHPTYKTGDASTWTAEFKRSGISFFPLVTKFSDSQYYGPTHLVRSYQAFMWLSEREADFDVVVLHDFLGNGYFPLIAKRQGLAFADVKFVMLLRATRRWIDKHSMTGVADADQLTYYYMEQKAVEYADVRISPNQYYLDWLERDGDCNMQRGRNTIMPNLPYPLPSAKQEIPRNAAPARHLVFYGRLDVLSGLDVFVQAINELISGGGTLPDAVSFVGASSFIGGKSSFVYLNQTTSAWPFKVFVQNDLPASQALEILRGADKIAVMPSYAENGSFMMEQVLAAGLPLIVTATPGTLPLLNSGDAAKCRCLAAPGDVAGLAQVLSGAMEKGVGTVRLAADYAQTLEQVKHMLWSLPDDEALRFVRKPLYRPRVTIGITSSNRGKYLIECFRSLAAMDYDKSMVEFIIVDDASTDPEVAPALELTSKEAAAAGLPLRIIQHTTSTFVAVSRNEILEMGTGEFVCYMDDDDTAEPHMLTTYMNVAGQTGADMLTDVSDNFQLDAATNKLVFHHRSLAAGDAFSANYFINYYGKANLCIRRSKALEMGGHNTGDRSRSPYVDWNLFYRASLAGLKIEIVPLPLYRYVMKSAGSIFYEMTDNKSRYDGHKKFIEDTSTLVPGPVSELLGYCRLHLGIPNLV